MAKTIMLCMLTWSVKRSISSSYLFSFFWMRSIYRQTAFANGVTVHNFMLPFNCLIGEIWIAFLIGQIPFAGAFLLDLHLILMLQVIQKKRLLNIHFNGKDLVCLKNEGRGCCHFISKLEITICSRKFATFSNNVKFSFLYLEISPC